MNNKQKKLFKKLFGKPTPKNIKYKDVEKALVGLGLDKKEGNGSAVSFSNGVNDLQFHKPHPEKEIKNYVVKLIKEYLETYCNFDDEGNCSENQKEDKKEEE